MEGRYSNVFEYSVPAFVSSGQSLNLYHTTRRHIPEDCSLHSYRRKTSYLLPAWSVIRQRFETSIFKIKA